VSPLRQTHALGWGVEEEEEEEEARLNFNSATTPRSPSPPHSPRGEDLPPSSLRPLTSPPPTPRSPAAPTTPRTPGGRAQLNPGYHIDGMEGVDSPMSPAASTAGFADGMLRRPLLFSHHRFDAPSMAEVRSVGGVLRSAHHRLQPEQLCHEVRAVSPSFPCIPAACRPPVSIPRPQYVCIVLTEMALGGAVRPFCTLTHGDAASFLRRR